MFHTHTYDIPFDQSGERFFVRDSFSRHNKKAKAAPKQQKKSVFLAFFKIKSN